MPTSICVYVVERPCNLAVLSVLCAHTVRLILDRLKKKIEVKRRVDSGRSFFFLSVVSRVTNRSLNSTMSVVAKLLYILIVLFLLENY